MPVVRPYPIAEVPAQSLPNVVPNVPAAGDLAAAGGNQAIDQQRAGANLAQTSDNVFGIYEREAREANDARVETDLNGFIDAKQKALASFVQLKGQDAVQASQGVTDNLLKLRKQFLDGAANPYQRQLLSRRMDAQMFDATGTITAHTANQSTAWQINSAETRSELTRRDGVMKRDDPNAIDGQLTSLVSVGQELARLKYGAAPDSDMAKNEVLKEQGKYLVGVIQARITDGNKRAALALYDKYEGIMKHDAGVASMMKGVRTEIDGENAANSALANVGMPQIRSGEGGDLPQKRQGMTSRLMQAGFSPNASAGIAANFEHESQFSPKAVNPRDGSDGSDSIGLGQWNGARAKALVQFARAKGLDPNSEAAQIGYMQAELNGDVPYSISGIKPDLKTRLDQAKSPEDAAAMLSREYFRPRDASEADSRGRTAAGIMTPTYRGDIKAGYEKAAAEIQNRTDLSPEVRANALATLNKTATQVTSYQTASLKALQDEANQFRIGMYLDPSRADPAKLASFADRAEALGDQTLATRYRLFASLAPALKNGLQSLPADQFKMLKSIEESLPKQFLEGIESGNADKLAQANDTFDKLKKAQADGLNPNGLQDMAKKAAQLYADAGKSEKAREVAQTFATMTAVGNVLAMNPVAQQQALAELEGIANSGQINEQQAEFHRLLKQGIATQQAEFDKDAFSAGQKLYGLPALPITDGAGRMEQAAKIASARGTGPIAPMTQEEFTALRAQADANPLAARDVFRSIAANYPSEAIPLIGAGLAGKADTNDPTSRGYAAALNFYAEGQHDPAQRVIGDEILDGIAKRREMGDALRNMPKSDAFYQAVQDKMGNAFKSLSGKVPAIIVNAAEAIYTSRMIKAGRQGEKALDPEVFNSALDAVVGKPITVNGQSLVPPKGVGSYQFDQALRSLSDGDVADFKTMNGSPVTAEKIARYGMLSNAGGDGQYFVELPDPARGGAPAYVQRPDGRPYVLEINPLIERSQRFPNYRMETPNSAKDARRRAPASPTEGLQ